MNGLGGAVVVSDGRKVKIATFSEGGSGSSRLQDLGTSLPTGGMAAAAARSPAADEMGTEMTEIRAEDNGDVEIGSLEEGVKRKSV
jgi:hypothetical protein